MHDRQASSPAYGRLRTAGFLLGVIGRLLAMGLGPLALSGGPNGGAASMGIMALIVAAEVAAGLGMLWE